MRIRERSAVPIGRRFGLEFPRESWLSVTTGDGAGRDVTDGNGLSQVLYDAGSSRR